MANERELQVQVPGDTGAQSTDPQATAATSQATDAATAQPAAVTAAAPASAARTRKASAPKDPRKDYLHLSGDEIDPTTIKSPVLSKDGWVAPGVPAAKA